MLSSSLKVPYLQVLLHPLIWCSGDTLAVRLVYRLLLWSRNDRCILENTVFCVTFTFCVLLSARLLIPAVFKCLLMFSECLELRKCYLDCLEICNIQMLVLISSVLLLIWIYTRRKSDHQHIQNVLLFMGSNGHKSFYCKYCKCRSVKEWQILKCLKWSGTGEDPWHSFCSDHIYCYDWVLLLYCKWTHQRKV
jgi:hypothetical protein